MNRRHQPRPAVQAAARARPLARWCALGIASLLLHLFAIQWAGGHIDGLSPSPPAEPAVIRAGLISPPIATAPAVPKPSPPRPPSRPRKPAREPAPAPAPEPSAMPPAAEEAQATAFDPRLGEDASVPLGEMPVADVIPLPPGAADPASPASPEPQRPQYAVAPPPSAVLKYDVKKVPREGNPTYGSGTITWRTDGKRYTVDGEAGVLFITALTFRSEGEFDASGVAPERYTEKRWRKPETSTHFHRERNTISFSASTLSYPRQGGEQDRASIIWQLAAIGRGDSAVFAPDAEIDVFVAGNRDGEVWKIRVIDQEEIKAAGQSVLAWHVRRAPRAGSYDQALDIWLAPQHAWYPVRLRYTERNGDYLDMTVSDMAPATAS